MRAALDGFAQLHFNFFELGQANHRADFGIGIGGGAEAQFFGFFDAELSEAFGCGLLDVDAFDGNAGLAAIHEAAPDGGAGGDVEIGVGEDDHRVLAAEFQDRWDQLFGRRLRRCVGLSRRCR